MADDFFVNVRNPEDIRRTLLGASKDVVVSLQRYEKFRISRIKREDHFEKLRKNISEINELVGRLRKELPQSKIRAKPTASSVRTTQKTSSELDKLEDELKQIEGKIGSLK